MDRKGHRSSQVLTDHDAVRFRLHGGVHFNEPQFPPGELQPAAMEGHKRRTALRVVQVPVVGLRHANRGVDYSYFWDTFGVRQSECQDAVSCKYFYSCFRLMC